MMWPASAYSMGTNETGGDEMRKYLQRWVVAAFLLAAILPVGSATGGEQTLSGDAREEVTGYRIGSGDVLSIVTWKEPDFTLEVMVRIDGKITFPLLDDLQAAGRTPVELKHDIEQRLKEYIAEPIVTVIVKSPFSQKYYILGEVENTGEYDLIKDLSVLQAFALAGGFTEWAAKDEIILLRREADTSKIIRINYKAIVRGENLDLDLRIRANDTIIVP